MRLAGRNALMTGAGSGIGQCMAQEAVIGRVIEEFGRLDTLVCNAGIAPAVALANVSENEWDEMIRVHLYGVFMTAPKLIADRARPHVNKLADPRTQIADSV